MLTFFRSRLYLAVVAGHFAVDVLNSTGPVLLAVLSVQLGLTYGQIGLALTLYTLAGSLSQPICGWLADRFRGRPTALAGAGVIWMIACYAAVALTQSWAMLLPFFLLASLGSGLFHPIGTTSAATSQRARAASATSLFFFCGQLGLAVGPVLGGLLFRAGGNLGMLPLCAAALLPAGLLLTAPAAPPAPAVLPRDARTGQRRRRAIGMGAAAFVALVALRSSIQASYTAFLPTLFAGRGWDSAAYGALLGTFMLSAAVGQLVTGELADRYGMRVVTVWPLLLGVPAGLLCLWSSAPAAAFVFGALAGFLLGGQHSILVLHAQRMLPTSQGFASGLILGFTFAAGGIGTWLAGLAADSVGLLAVMQAITLLGLPAAALAMTLPGREPAAPAVVPAEA